MKNIITKLQTIQAELKAPKNQYNGFGKYKYRSCEDILESVKPLLEKTKTVLVLKDEIQDVGVRTMVNYEEPERGTPNTKEINGRIYVKATATLFDTETAEEISSTAFAREDETKKGMDGSQITGTASSYARKYALNGLFAIDDAKDSDVTNKTDKDGIKANRQKTKPVTADRKLLIEKLTEQGKLETTLTWGGQQGYGSIDEFPDDTVIALLKKCEAQ